MGCDNVESSEVPTSKVRASIVVDAHDSGRAIVTVALTTDNEALLEETYLDLAPGDRLWAEVDGAVQSMSEIYVLGLINYRAEFDIDDATPTVNVAFERDIEVSAMDSYVAVPARFVLDPVSPDSTRSGGFPVSWGPIDPDTTRTTIDVSGPCIDNYSVRVDGDPGDAFIPPFAVRTREEMPSDSVCDIDIQVTRSITGTVDDNYGRGGTAFARTVQTANTTSVP
jgi:hypothetical protein